MRIVSLTPGSSDTVVALGLSLVGRTHECDAPGTADATICTESKVSLDDPLSARELDAASASSGAAAREASFWLPTLSRAASLVEWSLAPYRTHPDVLLGLRPDVIITQLQGCRTEEEMEELRAAVAEWMGYRPSIVHLDPRSLEDVWSDIQCIADACNATSAGAQLISRLQARMRAATDAARGRPRPSVACIQWADPAYAAGAWVPELIRMAGGNDVFGARDATPFSLSDLAAKEPENVVFAICGLGLEESEEQARTMLAATENGSSVRPSPQVPQGAAPAVGCGGGSPTTLGRGSGCGSPRGGSPIRGGGEKVTHMPGQNSPALAPRGPKAVVGDLLRHLPAVVRQAVTVVDARGLFSRPGPLVAETLEVLVEILHPEAQPYGHQDKVWRHLALA
eukprot:jgi/Mesvir1/18427/Mv14294-RA.1